MGDDKTCEVCDVRVTWPEHRGLTPVWRPWGIYCLFTCECCDEALGGHRKRRRIIGY